MMSLWKFVHFRTAGGTMPTYIHVYGVVYRSQWQKISFWSIVYVFLSSKWALKHPLLVIWTSSFQIFSQISPIVIPSSCNRNIAKLRIEKWISGAFISFITIQILANTERTHRNLQLLHGFLSSILFLWHYNLWLKMFRLLKMDSNHFYDHFSWSYMLAG